jgi:hypothetical protein
LHNQKKRAVFGGVLLAFLGCPVTNGLRHAAASAIIER